MRGFYEKVTVQSNGSGFHILLDGKFAHTPLGQKLLLPSEILAKEVAKELAAQSGKAKKQDMPLLKLVYTAQDAGHEGQQALLEDLLRFSTTDLLCYRASAPQALVERQNLLWDPILDWAGQYLGVHFAVYEGVCYGAQSENTLIKIKLYLQAISCPFALVALHNMTSLLGSVLLAIALFEQCFPLEEVWSLAHLDEDWQEKIWGQDEMAQQRRQKQFQALQSAYKAIEALKTPQPAA